MMFMSSVGERRALAPYFWKAADIVENTPLMYFLLDSTLVAHDCSLFITQLRKSATALLDQLKLPL